MTYKLVFLLFFLLNMSTTASSRTDMKVCLADRIVKSIPYYGESFINAAKLAIKSSSYDSRVVLKEYFYAWDPMEAIRSYRNMLMDRCDVIVGFSYLSDAMLIDKEKGSVRVFSPYSSFYNKPVLSSRFYTFMPPMELLAEKVIDFSDRRFKGREFVIIVEQNRNSSKEYFKAYKSVLKKRGYTWKMYSVLEGTKTVENFLSKEKFLLRNKNIILLAGVVTSATVIDTLNGQGNSYFGTETFGSSTAKSLYEKIKSKDDNIFFARNLDYLSSDKRLASFKEKFVGEFKTEPSILSAYTYDAVSASIKAHFNSGFDKLNFIGVSGMKFVHGAYFRSPNVILMGVSSSGYYKVGEFH